WPGWFKRRAPAGAHPALITDGGSPLVVAADGDLYFVCDDERMIPAGLQIGRLTPAGKATLVYPELRRISEGLGGIKGLAIGPDGSFFISYPKAIARVGRDGAIKP